jgi:hypothetical protein
LLHHDAVIPQKYVGESIMFKTMAVAAGLMAAGITGASASTLNISLDSHCNIFTLTTSKPFVFGTRGGCGYTVIDNGASASISHIPYMIISDQNGTSATFTW